ncbi:hypothetical protein LTR46_007419 [Exophiala xenobiotica]|nr:hypothetical protein LTR46_007419 [Exophiala xenobiotica]
MASPSKAGFPKFVDGDVLVIVSTTQYYKLHSQVLTTHSPWFAEQLAAKPPPRLNPQARRENAAAFRFELHRAPGGEGPGQFIRVDVNESGRSPRSSLSLMPDFENGKVENIHNQSWDWLFGVFYNREPRFDDTSLATILTCVMAVIETAESVGAIDHVRDIVDLALMRQDNVLWTSIMGNPVVWIELGRRVRSPAIYREAAIHLIGQWSVIKDEDKERIGEDIRTVLSRKADELALAKEAIEMRILGHYPQFMMRTALDKPGRPSYSGDIYMWMSVCFFRQWFAQNVSDDRTRRAPDGGLNFYSALHEGGGAYLTHLDFKTFHQYFPMSIKACHVLEANMGVLKEDIKHFVGDLMVERSHLKRAEHDIGWLTCARIEKEDMPWFTVASKGLKRKEDELKELYSALGEENALRSRSSMMMMNLDSREKGKGGMGKGKGKERDQDQDIDIDMGMGMGMGMAAPLLRPRKRLRVFEEDDGEDVDVEGEGDLRETFEQQQQRILERGHGGSDDDMDGDDEDDGGDGSGMFIPEDEF